MNLEVGKTYIRKDFLYSAVIHSIIGDRVAYEFCCMKDGYKDEVVITSAWFRKNYTIASELLMALI